MYLLGILAIVAMAQGTIYLPEMKDHLLSELLLRDIIDRMGNELVDAADSYIDYQDQARGTDDYDKAKEIPAEMPIDYEGIETLNPNPSIRDQEYLRHSTLNSHQRLNDNGDNRHRVQLAGLKGVKDEKTENTLPAYCTPPNPCPIGYTGQNHCIEDFENTAAFSRDYQSAQDCMCDTEHMIDCSNDSGSDRGIANVQLPNSEFDQIVEQFQETNPFFRGEKLPIAAKKGIHVIS
ncbi:neuroendocrine protein 7B2 [Diachasmimorpha longicaudata]|uniref:neuroendocrine protein 7B2 n=1 Tax=Diachasmimorpha longicaudata TaxID=58733 RepID=UPI0030B8CAAE